MPNNATIVKAAKTRALLVSQVNSMTEPARASAILEAVRSQLDEIGAKDDAAIKVMEGAAKAGMITRTKEGNAVFYSRNGVVVRTPNSEEPKKFSSLIETMTIADARIIYLQLHKMFGKG